MVKVISVSGPGRGKLGSVIYSVTAGQMIGRQYQPSVANPNTTAQVDQRAKFKLMSQLSAALAPVIVIPKEGLKSSRNLFVKRNSDNVSAVDGVAYVTYENLQLTNGSTGIPAIEAERSEAAGVAIHLAERCDASVSRVVYIMYKKTSEQTLQLVQSVIAESAGSDGTFPSSMYYTTGDLVLFAYGIKDLSAKASAKYANYKVQNGEDIAQLVLRRSISTSDYTFTATRGTTMFAGENSTINVPEGSARVFVTAQGNGQVSGAGVYEIGSQVTITATPNEGYIFLGWRNNGDTNTISTAESYTFTLEGTADLVAVFRAEGAASYSVEVRSNDTNLGTVELVGESVVAAGDSVTFKATAKQGAAFKGWRLFGTTAILSTAVEYTYVPQDDTDMEGVFAEGDGADE